jgi:hypothetical protein
MIMNNNNKHSFHIPVMGLGFTIDTPVKVAQYGISSVISIMDDVLIEKIREIYSEKFKIPFEPIPQKSEDSRAKRITAYLNLINEIVIEKFEELKSSLNKKSKDLQKYMELLPDNFILKQKINNFLEDNNQDEDLKSWIQNNLSAGSIDVNIMTKVDKDNYDENGKLPVQFNDAHSALLWLF